jgi:hypothetical protein
LFVNRPVIESPARNTNGAGLVIVNPLIFVDNTPMAFVLPSLGTTICHTSNAADTSYAPAKRNKLNDPFVAVVVTVGESTTVV